MSDQLLIGPDLALVNAAIAPVNAAIKAVPNRRITVAEPDSPPVQVAVHSLRPADSPRLAGVDPEHARALAEMDAELPPILVHHPTMRVIDGMHRLGAAQLKGDHVIGVRFFEGSEEEAFLLAVKTNIAHGLPLTLADRRAAAERIVRSRPEASDRWIAEIAGLAAKTVAAIRRHVWQSAPQLTGRIGRDGRFRPLSSAEGRRRAGELVIAQPEASLRKIAMYAGISVGTARDVRERIRRGEDPTPPKRRRATGPRVEPPVRPTVAPARSTVEPVDHLSILGRLRSDPSLRYTESGRALLRWLGPRVIGQSDWEDALRDVPPHCAIVIARIARGCARAWAELAEELERRTSECA